jgi:hypothetical protein
MALNTSLALFNDKEKAVIFPLLKQMGDEMKPKGLRPASAKAQDTKVRYESERCWRGSFSRLAREFLPGNFPRLPDLAWQLLRELPANRPVEAPENPNWGGKRIQF